MRYYVVTVLLYRLACQPPLYYDNYLTFTVRKRPRSIWGPIMLKPSTFSLSLTQLSDVLDSCTVHGLGQLKGALLKRSRLMYCTWRSQWLMGALLKHSRPVNSTWRCTPFYVQYRRRSPYSVLYMEHHIGHSCI